MDNVFRIKFFKELVSEALLKTLPSLIKKRISFFMQTFTNIVVHNWSKLPPYKCASGIYWRHRHFRCVIRGGLGRCERNLENSLHWCSSWLSFCLLVSKILSLPRGFLQIDNRNRLHRRPRPRAESDLVVKRKQSFRRWLLIQTLRDE